MRSSFRCLYQPIAWLLILTGISLAQTAAASANVATNEEQAIRSLVNDYFAAQAKKDVAAFSALWSRRAPARQARTEALRRLLPQEELSFTAPTIMRIRIESDSASARIATQRKIRNTETDVTRLVEVRADLSFVKEDGAWKVFAESPAASSLLNALVASQTDAERDSLLNQESELVSRDLLFLLGGQSDQAYATGDYPRALRLLQAACLVADRLNDKPQAAQAWQHIGIIHMMQKRPADAAAAYRKSLALEEALGRRAEIARSLNGLGLAHMSLQQHSLASDFFTRSLGIFQELKSASDIAQAWENIGNNLYEQGEYAHASKAYQQSVLVLDEAKRYGAAADRLLKVARTEYELGNDAAALEFYQQALTKFSAANNKRSLGYTLHNIANIYYGQGDYAQALRHYQMILKAEEAAGTRDGAASAWQGIGQVHSLNGNYRLALNAYQENLKIVRALANKADEAAALQRVAGAHFVLAEYPQALDIYRAALVLRQELNDQQDAAAALLDVGMTLAALNDSVGALQHYEQSRALFAAAGNQSGVAMALLGISQLSFARNDFAQAIEWADQAAVAAKQADDKDLLWQARQRIGRANFKLQKLDLARTALTEAIAIVETLRPQSPRAQQPRFYESKLAPFWAMVDVAIAQGKGNEAYDYVQRAKARVLLGVLQSSRVWINKTMTPAERERETRLLADLAILNAQRAREMEKEKPIKERLATLTAKQSKAQTDLAAFRQRLYALHPRLKVLRGEGKPLNSAQVAALLPDAQTALLEFIETDEQVYLFAFTKPTAIAAKRLRDPSALSPLRIYELGLSRSELALRVAGFQQAIASSADSCTVQARELYDLLLKTAQDQLTGKRRLVIAPDAVSWNLPFQALRTEADRYLIEDAALSYAPSLSAWGAFQAARKPAASMRAQSALLALTEPALTSDAQQRLQAMTLTEAAPAPTEPNAESEMLRQVVRNQSGQVLTGADAREDRFKAEAAKHSLLHLSVRGVFSENSPLFSLLALTASPEEQNAATDDGLLEVREIVPLDLPVELVTLSAGEVAAPRNGVGRALTGWSWAWLVAGCPVTLVNVGPRDQGAATELLREFYQQLAAKQGKAQAWQAAVQLLLKREEYRRPSSWAGFLLLGDAR